MCHAHRSHRAYADVRRAGPDLPGRLDLRASDAERERTAEALREHAGEGRLAPDELEERIGRALTASTRAELHALTADLPPRPRPAPVPDRAAGWRRWLAVAAILLVIWVLSGGTFWPAWPLGIWGAALVARTIAAPRPRRRGALPG